MDTQPNKPGSSWRILFTVLAVSAMRSVAIHAGHADLPAQPVAVSTTAATPAKGWITLIPDPTNGGVKAPLSQWVALNVPTNWAVCKYGEHALRTHDAVTIAAVNKHFLNAFNQAAEKDHGEQKVGVAALQTMREEAVKEFDRSLP